MGPDFGRAIVAMVIVGFIAGAIIAAGLPWLWSERVKPFLTWLVL